MTAPLVEQVVSQAHQLPEHSLIRSALQEVRAEQAKNLEKRVERLKEVAPLKTRRALDLTTEKGSSMWLTSLPLKEMGFNLNKSSRQFRDGLLWMALYNRSRHDLYERWLCNSET